jgi:hypothetical protein
VGHAYAAGRWRDHGQRMNYVRFSGEWFGWSAVLYGPFLAGRVAFTQLERWQTAYLPVYALWAWVVVASRFTSAV